MAKHPDDSKRPQPEPGKKPDGEDALKPERKLSTRSDSEIDLGAAPPEDDLSGVSVIEWAKLSDSENSGDSKTGLNRPLSDDDVLAELSRPSTGSDSSIDLSDHSLPTSDQLIASADIDEDSAIDLLEAARIAEKPLSNRYDDDDAIELGDESLLAGSSNDLPDSDASDLGLDAVKVRERPGDSDSEIDLGDPTVAPVARVSESDVNFLAEDLLSTPGSGTSSSSSRDLIAEELESGVDLAGGKKTPAPAAKDPLEEFFEEGGVEDTESSSVDLGSMHSMPVFDVPEEEAAALMAKAKKVPAKPVDEAGPSSAEIRLDQLGEDEEPDAAADSEINLVRPGKKGKSKLEPVEDDEDEAPVKPAPRRRVPALVGGLAWALVGGALTLGGAWAGGFLATPGASAPPPQGIAAVPANPGTAAPPPAAVVTFEATIDNLRSGNLDKITEAELEKVDEAKQEQVVARAEVRWLNYLRGLRGKNPNAVLQPTAEPVQKALVDLNKAILSTNLNASAEALFLRGQIYEMTGNVAAAKQDYANGAKKFGQNPVQREKFETALRIMELTGKLSHLTPKDVDPRLFALMLIAFQPPSGEGAAQPLPAEAGFAFWQAVQRAKAGDYAGAYKLLETARARHDQRRYLLPRKQQNPSSDPLEQIFLRSCDELRDYWGMLARLNNPSYLTAAKGDRIPQVDSLLTKVDQGARAAMLRDLAAKLTKDKVGTPEELVKVIAAERQANEAELTKRNVAIGEQKKEIADLGGKLTEAGKTLLATRDTLKTTQGNLDQSREANAAALAALKDVGTAVGSEFKDLPTSKDPLLRDVRAAARLAKEADPKGLIRRLERDLDDTRTKLGQRWEPAQMLAVWLPVLDQERSRQDLATRANADAERVLTDAAAKPETKAQALLVHGLVLRNTEKFNEAKPVLAKAREQLAGEDRARCDAALKEVSDPAGAIAAKARELDLQGKSSEALAVLERGLKGLKDRKGALYAQRGRIAFEAARSKGPLTLTDPLVASATADAKAAAAEGLAEGHYALGRIEEELGRPAEAEKAYRSALKAHGEKADEDGARYRVALARVLLKQQPALSMGPASSTSLPWDARGLFVFFALQAPGSGEAEKLLDDVLNKETKAPADVVAQALALKGLHTRAVNTYVRGLRDSGKLAPEYANSLLELINSHPVLRRPDSLATPDPLKAERFYAAGVNSYFNRKYTDAEKELIAAIENDGSDARYYYYLGLARLALGKREAYEDFDQAAKLEQLGRPGSAAVSSALERIQGRARKVLNDVRTRP